MPEKQDSADYGRKIISWRVPEYDKHVRSQSWYIISASCGLLFLVYSFMSGNFLFAAIIIIGALIIIIHDGREPLQVDFNITSEGIMIGKKFHDYDEVKDFSIIYKPHQEVKNLYFEFKSALKPRLSIPLQGQNPLPIRENLLKYLPEDLERTDQPVSEVLAKMFKL